MQNYRKAFLVLPLLLGAACGYINLPQSATPQHADYHAPAHVVTSASVTVESIAENVAMHPATGDNYFDAEIDYLATVNFDANATNDAYSVSLVERAQTLNYSGAPLLWDVGVQPAAPLKLSAASSSGDLALNLKDFTLTGLDARTSSGAIDVHLPAGADSYPVSLDTSSGAVSAALEDGGAVEFSKFNSSSGSLTLNSGSGSTVRGSVTTSSGAVALNFGANTRAALDVTTSSGSVTVSVPQGAALRLQIDRNSSGGVNVPVWLHRVSGEDKTGVWESEGFAQAARQIIVRITDSSGAISVAQGGA
jgi:hypothetical protein